MAIAVILLLLWVQLNHRVNTHDGNAQMVDPPARPLEASPTNTQGTTEFSVENFQPRVANIPLRVAKKRPTTE
jgi:hypothetical protein